MISHVTNHNIQLLKGLKFLSFIEIGGLKDVETIETPKTAIEVLKLKVLTAEGREGVLTFSTFNPELYEEPFFFLSDPNGFAKFREDVKIEGSTTIADIQYYFDTEFTVHIIDMQLESDYTIHFELSVKADGVEDLNDLKLRFEINS